MSPKTEMTGRDAELSDESWLLARLPALMVEFRAAVESLGFVYEEVSK